MRSPVRRRAVYYAVVLIGAIAVHQGFIASIGGEGLSDLLRRNSEAYAMMVILPAYWDIFAAPADPDGGGAVAAIGRGWLPQATWFIALVLVALALQSDLLDAMGVRLPQAIVTLGEAFVAGIVICAYLGWSRRILPIGGEHDITGAAESPLRVRAVYYAGVVVVSVAVQQSWFAAVAGEDLTGWFQVNIEAYAAMLLVPAYFDIVAPAQRRWVRPVWYGFLVAAPVLVQGGLLDDVVPESLLAWFGRTTEAFIATFVISGYFDVWRGRRREHVVSTSRKDGEGTR